MFVTAAQRLQKKKGVNKQVVPWLEGDRMEVDLFLFKHRKVVAFLAIIVSLLLFVTIK
jgi:hypothetical protein